MMYFTVNVALAERLFSYYAKEIAVVRDARHHTR